MEDYFKLETPYSYLREDALECPMCGTYMIPKYNFAINGIKALANHLIVFCSCTQKDCKSPFLAKFLITSYSKSHMYGNVPYAGESEVLFYNGFEQTPEEIDPYSRLIDKRPFYSTFIDIYRQARVAELENLDQIAGMGYRKALEFLIKEYAVHLYEQDQNDIQKRPLMQVIENYFKDDKKLVEISKRAAWLGNDEIHFLKKWVDKDVNDLKAVIIITLQTIEHNESYKDYLNSMPDPIK